MADPSYIYADPAHAGKFAGPFPVWTESAYYVTTSVDAKHHGTSLSERWNVTWVGNNSIYTH